MSINNELVQKIILLLMKCDIKTLCNDYFADKFMWTIKGTSILSGTYTDKNAFFTQVLDRLNNILQPNWRMHIRNTYIANNTFIVEMRGEVKTKNGQDYNNDYCWIFKFANEKIISVTAYYDSLLVNKILNDYEVKLLSQ